MKKIQLWLLGIVSIIAMASCAKNEVEAPEETAPDTARVAGTNWVPARAKLLRDTSYSYSKVIPYKNANGILVYDKANSETRQGKGYVYYDEKFKVVYMVDWPGVAGNAAAGAGGFEAFYFNFDKKHNITQEAALSGKASWHIKFYDIYTAYIVTDGVANSEDDLGKLRVYRTPFNELDEAMDKTMLRTSVEIEMEDNSMVDGWGRYRLSDHILHPYDRTIVFRLKDGRYVKFQLMNLYRTNPSLVKDKYEFEAPFYNFRYYVQEAPNNRTIKTR